jgi:hypothetical protein
LIAIGWREDDRETLAAYYIFNQQSWRQPLPPSYPGGGNNCRTLINTDFMPNSSRHQFYGGTLDSVSLNYNL